VVSGRGNYHHLRPVTGVSKLASILFTKELQRRFNESSIPIIAIAVNPGNVNTFANQLWFPTITGWLMRIFFQHPDDGALNSVFAAASPVVLEHAEKYKGAYLEPVGVVGEPSKVAQDEGLGRALWDSTAAFMEGMGMSLKHAVADK